MSVKIDAVIEAIKEKVAILRLECADAPPLHLRRIEWPLEQLPAEASRGESIKIDLLRTPLHDYIQEVAKAGIADMVTSANPPISN